MKNLIGKKEKSFYQILREKKIWVLEGGENRRWVFKFMGFGEEGLEKLERLDFKKARL